MEVRGSQSGADEDSRLAEYNTGYVGVELQSFQMILLPHLQGPFIPRIMDYLEPEGGGNILFRDVCRKNTN